MARRTSSRSESQTLGASSKETSSQAISTELPKKTAEPPSVVYQKSSDFRSIYANSSKVGISQWDFTISFGQSSEINDGKIIAEEAISIKFSPHYFKAMVAGLRGAVDQWEALFGVLPQGLGQRSDISSMKDAFEKMRSVLESVPQPSPNSD